MLVNVVDHVWTIEIAKPATAGECTDQEEAILGLVAPPHPEAIRIKDGATDQRSLQTAVKAVQQHARKGGAAHVEEHWHA